MNAADALETFAAVSVGIAGFSAIVVALTANVVVSDARRINWALAIIFGWSLGATLFSILPFIFYAFAMPEALLWRVGLLAMSSAMAIGGTAVLLTDGRLNRSGVTMRGAVHDSPRRRSRAMLPATGVYILTAGMLAAAGVCLPNAGFYFIGLTVMLALSIWVLMFVFFLLGFTRRQH